MSFDCQTCGACCLSDSKAYVPVTESDSERLRDHGSHSLTVEVDGSWHMRMTDGHCAALVVRAGKFVCDVYEARPEACRELAAATPACQEEVRLKIRTASKLLESS